MDAAQRVRVAGLALALGLLALWAVLFEPFAFPNNDYYSFERAARSFAAGELPRSLKRGPVLPALMAATAPLAPGRHPELRAALAWNLAFSLGFFVLLVRFAWRTLPAAALPFALVLATAPVLHAMALQPLVEPSLSFFVALAFVLLRERSAWQYAAAALAALSRPEAIWLVPVLAGVNAVAERRPLRHGVLAGLAVLPFAGWNLLGAERSTGALTYLEIMQGASLRGFALVGVHYLREGFSGWSAQGTLGLVLGAVMVGLFGAVGAREALRRAPRETAAMAAFLGLSALSVGLFGISKTRYVEPTIWIPLLWVVQGVVAFAQRLEAPETPRMATIVTAILCATLMLGGAQRGVGLYRQVRDFDREVLPAALWLGAQLGPDERVAIVHTSQVLWVTDLAPGQVVAYGTFAADDLASLREEMRARGITHAAWTWRQPPRTDSQRFYDERKKVSLSDPFATGAPVPGFDLVATLPDPTGHHPPSHIYRTKGTFQLFPN